MTHAFALLTCLAFLAPAVRSVFTTISSATEFVAFADEVNSGTTYRGSTVTLTSDIDFTGVNFPGVGMYVNSTFQRYFRGTFDGNGHTISNMHLYSTTTTYLGLFSVVNGGVIKGIVVDSSCSVVNDVPKYYTYAGGIVANSISGIEFKMYDCVNMATVTGTGPKANIGGIIGCLYAFAFPATVYNCVNFGDVNNSGVGEDTSTGGIVGWMSQEEPSIISGVYNCVNLGTVTGATEKVGAIVGNIESTDYTIKNAFWVSGSSAMPFPSSATADTSEALGTDFSVSGGKFLADVMNAYVDTMSDLPLRRWGKVTLHANGDEPVGTRATLFVIVGDPGVPVRMGHSFKGWYTDAEFGAELDVKARYENGVGAELYAKWEINNYTVSFAAGLGRASVAPVTTEFGNTIQLEKPTKEGHTFDGWRDEKGNVFFDSYRVEEDKDVVLTALWTVNNYTLTFDFGNETVVEEIVDYGDLIVYPENPEKIGYSFNGWDNAIERMPAKDVLIKALWSLNNYTVLFDFGNGTVVEELVVYDDLIEYPKNLGERVGYSFNGWDNNIERMPAKDVVIRALWSLNNYTVTFDFDDGTTTVKTIEYNGPIEYPENPKREGYIFAGWDSSITSMPAEDITIKALWSELSTEYVEIVFGKKDMTEGEIHKIISKYAQDDSYEIKVFEAEDESTRVIVKFVDAEDASLFYRSVKMSSERGFVRSIKFTDEVEYTLSFTAGILPLGASLLFMLF